MVKKAIEMGRGDPYVIWLEIGCRYYIEAEGSRSDHVVKLYLYVEYIQR